MPASWSIDDFKIRVVLRVRREIEVGIGEEDDEGDCEGQEGYPEAEGHRRVRNEGYIYKRDRGWIMRMQCNGPIKINKTQKCLARS